MKRNEDALSFKADELIYSLIITTYSKHNNMGLQ